MSQPSQPQTSSVYDTQAQVAPPVDTVTVTIDGKTLSVPKGVNVIEAAKLAGNEIPFYCYHPHLSVAGNCRMCQVQIKGRPKLEIGCNTIVADGMEIPTHVTSPEVAASQSANLEFILINHPLDCTICDQAGHCKLQDYHYGYNAKQSRFVEEKEHKVKGEILGPHVILDGERCIMCTRCIRFCDEVTGTSELGMLNRGDRSVISINKNKPLDNALSGTVVDLCPVGALTHRDWRFNTRIWFTKSSEGICPGCSTGCNTRVYERDNQVVQVKGRLNAEVNKEWMCDEGRYGYGRFLPSERTTSAVFNGDNVVLHDGVEKAKAIASCGKVLIFASAELTVEDFVALKHFTHSALKEFRIVLNYKERPLNDVQKILVSPDYAPNYQAAVLLGLVPPSTVDMQREYEEAVMQLRKGEVEGVMVLGDHAILREDIDSQLKTGLRSSKIAITTLSDLHHPLLDASTINFPAKSIVEKSGLLINRQSRIQYSSQALMAPEGALSEWAILNMVGKALGKKINDAQNDREQSVWSLGSEEILKGLSIKQIKNEGGVVIEPVVQEVQGGTQ